MCTELAILDTLTDNDGDKSLKKFRPSWCHVWIFALASVSSLAYLYCILCKLPDNFLKSTNLMRCYFPSMDYGLPLSLSLQFFTPLSPGMCWSSCMEHLLPPPYLANLNLTFNIKLKLSERLFCPHLHPPLFILRTVHGGSVVVVFQLLSWTTTVVKLSNSLWPHGLQHGRLPCSSLFLGVSSNSCPLSQWCLPTISSSVIPFFSCLQSFPASGSFPMSRPFALGG